MTTFRRGRRPGSRERPNTATLAHPSILDETLKVSISSIRVSKMLCFLSLQDINVSRFRFYERLCFFFFLSLVFGEKKINYLLNFAVFKKFVGA
jgi:hypothetical protein